MRSRTILSLAVLALLVAGCGGSGGNAGTPAAQDRAALLSGTYCTFGFRGDHFQGQQEAVASWGELIADGAGGLTWREATNQNGVVSSLGAPVALTYEIDADRNVIVARQNAAWQLGRVTADGSLACWAAAQNGSSPGITLLGRKEHGADTALLQGLYHLCAFLADPTTSDGGTFFGTATFDGQGLAEATYHRNIGGIVSGPLMNQGTYDVGIAGTVTGDFLVGAQLEGAVFEGGDVVVLAGGTAFGNIPMLVVLTRASIGATFEMVAGSYVGVNVTRDDTDAEWRGGMFEGVGGAGQTLFTINYLLQNTEGIVASTPANSVLGFFVNPDGSVQGDNLLGGMTAAGEVAALVGLGSSISPSLYVLLR